MPSRSAASRASAMSRPAQQAPLRPVAVPWSWSGRVTPTPSWPASASSPAATALSTPPDMATTMRPVAPNGSAAEQGRAGDADGQAVERRAQAHLAAEARGAGEVAGEVEHVLLLRRGRRQAVDPVLVDVDVAGGAGHLAAAGPLHVDAVQARRLEQARTVGGRGRPTVPAREDEGHQRQGRVRP